MQQTVATIQFLSIIFNNFEAAIAAAHNVLVSIKILRIYLSVWSVPSVGYTSSRISFTAFVESNFIWKIKKKKKIRKKNRNFSTYIS